MFYEYFKLSSITPGKNSIHQQFMIYVVCSMDVKTYICLIYHLLIFQMRET